MHKYRNWLMGLGIGLIVGASMLQLIIMAQKQMVVVPEPIALTRDQLVEEAKKSDLVLLTSEQLEARLTKAVAEALEKEKSNRAQEPVSDSKSTLNPPDDKATPEDKNTPEATEVKLTDPNVTEVKVYIAYKMNLSDVANKLYALGVIDDVDNFVTAAWSISKKVSVGTAVFTDKMTTKEIIAEITREKED